jgi:triosephosphate isomerase
MKTIIANWKMNLGVRESVALTRASLLLLRGKKIAPHLVLCPSFIALSEVRKVLAHSSVSLGAQNVSWEEHGAYTGEISVRMLSEVGTTHVIVGHSERRHWFGETDESVNKKVLKLLEQHFTPIVCVGETKEEHDAGEARARVTHQLSATWRYVHVKSSDRFMIAYEPVWAIGTGETPTVQEVVEMHTHIRDLMRELHGKESTVLYGGSVDGENVYSFLREPMVDGVLVGGASVKIQEMKAIVDAAADVLSKQSTL